MSENFTREQISKQVNFSFVEDSKFKSNRISVNLIVPISPETVSNNAILPFIMRKGCKKYPKFTLLNRRLDELYGASLSSDVGKVGANQIITFGISFIDDKFAYGHERMVEECAMLLREIVFAPMIADGEFPIEDISVEKQNLVDTIEAAINDKRSYAVTKCRELMGRGMPSATQRYGTVEGAGLITAKSAAQAYDRLIKSATAEIVFVGCGNSEPVKETFSYAFSSIERAACATAVMDKFEAPQVPFEKTEIMDVSQSKLVMGFRVDGSVNSSSAKLMSAVYGATPSSKLFLNVREKLSLCYYCAARYDRTGSVIMVDSGVQQENLSKAKTEILNQLEEIRQGKFDEEMVKNTISLLENALRSIEDSPSSIEEWYLSKIITGEICSPKQEIEKMAKVTRQDIIAAACATKLDTVFILCPKEEI